MELFNKMTASLWFCFFGFACFGCILAEPRRAIASLGRYYVSWDGGMKPCKDMENKIFDLEKLVVEKKSKTVLALVGDVGLKKETTTKITFKLTIYKEVNGNFEYFAKFEEENLCKHIAEKNKPWSPFVAEMGITGCPIPEKIYTFKNSTLDTAGFVLTAANAGNYRGKIELFERGVRTTCSWATVVVEPL